MVGFNRSKNTIGGAIFATLFFGVFLSLGAFFMYMMLIAPWLKVNDAANWQTIPCTIISQDIKVHRGEDTSYEPVIIYEYKVQGRSYSGNKYSFFDNKYSSRAKAKSTLRNYPVGTSATCYVNPADPHQAVLFRGWMSEGYWGFFGLPFFLVGLFGILYGTGILKTKEKGKSSAFKASHSKGIGENETILKSESSRFGRLAGMIFVATFWNGIVSIFVYQGVIRDFQWFLALFMIPFVVVGIGLIFGVFYYLLALFNPKPILILKNTLIRRGDEVGIEWQLSGKTSRIQRLRIYLEGEEQATYQRGTDTRTDKNIFHQDVLFDHAVKPMPSRGQIVAQVPVDTAPTFLASRNKIVWRIRVSGEIATWPDVNESFTINIKP